MSKLRLFYVLNFVSNGLTLCFLWFVSFSVFGQLERLYTLRIYRVVHNIKIYDHALAFIVSRRIGHHNIVWTFSMFFFFFTVGLETLLWYLGER